MVGKYDAVGRIMVCRVKWTINSLQYTITLYSVQYSSYTRDVQYDVAPQQGASLEEPLLCTVVYSVQFYTVHCI